MQNLLAIAVSYVKESMNETIMPAHLLKALLHEDVGLVSFIENQLDKDYYYILEWADTQIYFIQKTTKVKDDPELSEESKSVLNEAGSYCTKLDATKIEPVHILLALVTPGVGFSFDQLKTLPLTADEILAKLSVPIKYQAKQEPGSSNISLKSLSKYTVNKNIDLEDSRMHQIIGFEKELQILLDTLGRKNKSNVLILGESGVGKTALINGFVQRILNQEVPGQLVETIVYDLDLSMVSSEANYKGEVEDRVKKILRELKNIENAVLVIEGIDKMFDRQSILYGVSSLLKKELDRNTIKLIVTTSIEGFTKNIETDKEFVYKFEKITLEEPDPEMALRIIKGIRSGYEQHHGLEVTDGVIKEAIRLAKRFMAEKSLPDSALDLIDKTLSHIQTMNNISERELDLLSDKLQSIRDKEADTEDAETAFELQWLYYEIFNRLSFLLTSQLDERVDFSEFETNTQKTDYLVSLLEQLKKLAANKRAQVEIPDLAIIIAQQTGLPIGKVQSKERDKLIHAEAILKERVVGQDHAIRTVLDAIYESRSGLSKKGQPMASVFFLGPTGTGKTELTKALAEFLFQDESAIIRFDMSEFMESHSVATMTGAPAGYVGYEEGGLLVNKIRQKPYSIVLFDEIEKAHPDVFNIFLQIMDEGRIHDKLNRTGDFSNALVVFTSNVGSDYIFNSFEKGIIPSSNDLKLLMREHKFKPEFLGRLTEIIPFSPITKEIVMMIFDIHLKGLLKMLEELKIELTMNTETKEQLALSEFSAALGARPIIGIIRNQIRRPLSKLIISGDVKSGSKVELIYKDGTYEWKY